VATVARLPAGRYAPHVATPERPARGSPLGAVGRVLTRCGRAIVSALDRAGRDNVTGAASQFAYSAFLATVPFFAVVLSLVGIFGGGDAFEELVDSIGSGLPDDANDQLQRALTSATDDAGRRAALLIIGGAAGLYITAGAIGALIRALDNAYDVPHRSWWESRLVSLALAASACVLVLVTVATLVGGPRLIDTVADAFGLGGDFRSIAKDLVIPVGILGLCAFTLLLYRYGPNTGRRPLWALLPGTVLSVAAWYLATRLFRIYVLRFDSYNAVYGSLAAVAVYLVFLWLSGLSLLLGGEVNGLIYRVVKRRSAR
jgi:membrane protein